MVMCVGGRCHCGWHGQLDEVGHGGRWHHDVSLHNRIIGLLLLLASALVLLLQLDDVMNLGDVTHIEAAKHLRAQLITSPPSLNNI